MQIESHIGTLTDRVLVFGGVYSNLQALTALQVVAKREGIPPDHILCTGDVVGYCAEPEKAVQAIKAWGIHCMAGNVELNLRDEADDCGCNFDEGSRCDLFSRQWYPYAQAQLSEDSLNWIKGLPQYLRFQFGGQAGIVLHGAYQETSRFVFASTPWAVKAAQFAQTNTQLILAGHCGIPFAQQQHGLSWLNAGVIGMPANDGTPRVWYLILEETQHGWTHQFHALTYDYQQASQLMLAQPLPTSYAQTLVTGIWDNCDILPQTETNQQGISLTINRRKANHRPSTPKIMST